MGTKKVGIVDLDTSHPGSWAPIIRELGYELSGVIDGGIVHDEGYAKRFAEKHGIGRVYGTLEEMAGDVDIAIIHTVDWGRHVERSAPFVRAGAAVLVDKPMAGSVDDLKQLLEWEKNGARITGGSSLAVCAEVAEWHARRDPEDRILSAFAGCSVDEFNYAIHAYSLLLGIMGPGIATVRWLGSHVQQQVELVWRDGRRAIVNIGSTAGYLPFYATIVTERKVEHIEVDNGRLYRALLERVLPYLAGETGPFMALESLLEPEYAAIAAKMSQAEGGRCVPLAEVVTGNSRFVYDGGAFAEQYRRKARGL